MRVMSLVRRVMSLEMRVMSLVMNHLSVLTMMMINYSLGSTAFFKFLPAFCRSKTACLRPLTTSRGHIVALLGHITQVSSMGTEQLSWHSLKSLTLFIRKKNKTSTGTRSAAPGEMISPNTATLYVQKESGRLLRSSEKNIQEGDALQLKASIPLQGLFNLVAQRDQNTNTKIARETKQLSELAKQDSARTIQIAADSRTLARESNRDSTSMKAIAAVTMFVCGSTFFLFQVRC